MKTALVALAASGCSLLGVTRPQPPRPDGTPDICTTSNVAPGLDTAIAAITGLIALSVAGCQGDQCGAPGFAAVILGVPFTLSAIYGFQSTGVCRKRNSIDALARRRELPDALDRANEVVAAARAGDCGTVKLALPRLDYFRDVVARVPEVAHCFVPRPVDRYCYDTAIDGSTTTLCLPSKADCVHASDLAPPGTEITTCRSTP